MGNPIRVHNDYLNVAVDLGVVGVVLLGFPLVALLWRIARLQLSFRENSFSRNRKKDDMQAWQAASCFGLVSLLIHSSADFHLFVPANGMVASVFVGLILMVPDSNRRTHKGDDVGMRWPMKGRFVILMSMLLVLSNVLISNSYRLGGAVWAQLARNTKTYSHTVERYKMSLSWMPDNPRVLLRLAEIYRLRSFAGAADFERTANSALELYQRLITIVPSDPYPQVRMGMCLDWLGLYDEADGHFDAAIELDPNNKAVVAAQGWHAFQREDYRGAVEWFQKARKMPHMPDPIATTYLPLALERLKEAGR